MAEEPQPQTIQERIAALNQSHVGRTPSSSPAQPYPLRPKSVNNPPHELNGSVVDRKEIGNKPASTRQNGVLPPPTTSVTTTTTQNTPARIAPKQPPPLPARKGSSQSAPALPPRRPSAQSERRTSSESLGSNASYSTVSTTGTANTVDSKGSKNRLIAPAWRETELPPLPTRPSLPPRKSLTLSETEKARRISKAPLDPPPLPSRPSNGGDQTTAPPLPARTPSYEARKLPQLPVQGLQGETVRQAPRKVPPAPSADMLHKVRQSSFATLSSHAEVEEAEEAKPDPNLPPAIPLSSRPDLSLIQATKPKFNGVSHGSSANATASTVCMICRDFSGPDNHAAQFPRESLPTNDLAWLATQLTAPFPSLTDKARAIFTWLHYNIKYDVDSFFNNCVQPSTPSRTLATGLAVCEGYAGLFATLANKAGLEALVIGGHGKGFGYSQLALGSSIPPFAGNHAWNVVKIDGGKWKLIDTCWGAGAVNGKGQPYIQRFDPTNFTKPNDEFLLSHYPEKKDQFYTDNGGPGMSWEAYMRQDHTKPFGIEQPIIFVDAREEGLGDRSFRPACQKISIHQPGPIRFQFNFKCEHWTLTKHSKKSAPYLFLLDTHGIDGRKDEKIPFTHVRGTGPNGGGDFWFVDVADPRTLGAPGQKLGIANIKSMGSTQDARGLSLQEYQAQVGRVGMSWSYIAQWELTA